MGWSRQNPSPRFRELLEQYRRMHREGSPEKGVPAADTFNGLSLPRHAAAIKTLIARTAARTILDYGSGKGVQYRSGIPAYWGVDAVHCYDPGYEPFSQLPQGRFHGVVSTDVLEHCPEEDVAWIIGEMFAYAERFVYANVACAPAVKTLPNGENAHCTVRPPSYWNGLFAAEAARRPGLLWELRADVIDAGRMVEVRSGNFA